MCMWLWLIYSKSGYSIYVLPSVNSPRQTASAHMFSHTWQLPDRHVINLRSLLDPSHACPFIVHDVVI